jgi:hydrogenase nickel incorporation protein HypA/HybF
MHEVSIADSLLRIAGQECGKGGFSTIESIKVSIGRASGVMPEALLFAFDAMKAGTIAGGASLVIEEVPVSGHCSDCAADFSVEEAYVLCCPLCGGQAFTLCSGRELHITELEVE